MTPIVFEKGLLSYQEHDSVLEVFGQAYVFNFVVGVIGLGQRQQELSLELVLDEDHVDQTLPDNLAILGGVSGDREKFSC